MKIKLTRRQTQAFDIWADTRNVYQKDDPDSGTDILLYGGAKGGGKTRLAGGVCLPYECDYLIDFFGFKPSDKPPLIGFIGRKRGTDFRLTTLETIKRYVNPDLYTINEQKKEIVWRNTVRVAFGGLDDTETVQKFNSAELCFAIIDQAEECTVDDLTALRASLRFTYNGLQPVYKLMFTANPAQCFLKQEFFPPKTKNRYYIPALPSDNPHLPGGYIDKLRDTYGHDPNLLSAYLYGNWDVMTGARQLFTQKELSDCYDVIEEGDVDGDYKIISLDLARFGDDRSAIYLFRNNTVFDKIVYGKKDVEYTYGVVRDQYDRIYDGSGRKPLFVLDTTDPFGCGGIYDRLIIKYPEQVLGFNNSTSASNAELYANKRAENFGEAKKEIMRQRHRIPRDDIQLHKELMLQTYGYKPNTNQFFMVPKEEIKKLNDGISPDLADAYINGLAGLRYLRLNAGRIDAFRPQWSEAKPQWVRKREEEALMSRLGIDVESAGSLEEM